jgi:hypothetical protein
VQRVSERLSVEEIEQRSATSARRVSFKETLGYEFVEIPGTQGVRGRSKSSRRLISKEIMGRNLQKE